MKLNLALHNVYSVECFDKDGKLKWRETINNLVTNEGLNELLQQYFKGSAYSASFAVGLKGSGTAVAADTMSSHGSWTEFVAYSQTTRGALTLGSVSAQSVSTSSAATFTINGGGGTVAGAFISTDNTKSGTTGKLFGVADFAVARTTAAGDTINVNATLAAATQ